MIKYRKLVFTFIIILLCVYSISGASIDIVYPKKNGVSINAKSTFFVGSTNPKKKLYINSQEVEVAPNGGFAHYVKLENEGVNNFQIQSGSEVINFTVIKPPKSSDNTNSQQNILTEYSLKEYRVIKKTPLRSTPVDGGINRLCELPCQTKLLINGEKGKFYRVYLNKDCYGWVDKNDTEISENQNTEFAELKKVKKKTHKEYTQYEIYLSDRIPFSINETENNLLFTLYNINNKNCCSTISHNFKKLAGYSYEYRHDKLIIKIKNEKTLIHNPVIVIDAGHGGNEKGAIGCCRVPEKDINLKIAKYIHEELKKRGYHSVLTRNNDTTLSLAKRCEIAEENDASILVSIHSNALPDGQNPLNHSGTSVYYYHPQAKSLAENVLFEIVQQVKTNNDRVRQASLALVRPTSSVSILVEVAYMINPYDYTLLTDENFQISCAKAVADGIIKYLQSS